MNEHSVTIEAKSNLLKSPASRLQYPPISCRRMRNTAILVKWIEEHQSNPYPTKAEKQYLGFYSGMNLTQLSTWFANARRRIKKIGMKVWLEGRSTFTVDFFPSPTARPSMTADSGYTSGGSYTNPYVYPQLTTGYPTQPSSASTLGLQSQRMQLSNGHSSVYSADNSSYGSTITSSSLYGSQQRSAFTQPLIGMPNLANWPAMPSTTHLLPTTSSLSIVHPTRPSSHNVPPIHSPLTAQVYSTDTLRTQTALDVTDGTYSYQQQHSPDSQILPECASSEPSMLQESPKTHYHSHTD